jgi:D-alanine---D-serine ligase
MKRLKIAVLFGGCSPEYSVSLQSAAAVLQNMDSSKYEAVMVGISKMGDWYSYTGPIEKISKMTLGLTRKSALPPWCCRTEANTFGSVLVSFR